MTLTLSMLRCPDNVVPETRVVAGGEYSIGRGPENNWVLPDPERGLSKQHCVIAYRAGGWQIADLSTNGTFLNRENEAIGRGPARDLRDGDRLSFGAYEIEIRITADATRGAAPADPFAVGRPTQGADPFALDPFARPLRQGDGGSSAHNPFLDEAGLGSGLGPAPITLPPDFDPLAPEGPEPEYRGPTQSDHSPHVEDAFAPPAPRAVLPEDWDREVNAHRSAAAPPAVEEAFVPAPLQPVARTPAATAEAQFTREPAPPPQSAAAPTPTPAVTAAAATAAVVPAAAVPDALLAAFLHGAGLADLHPADPVAMMQALGAAFRAVVAGLRQAMIARAAVKGEFRIEQTMIRSRGNNPLKFSADDDDALAALLGVGRHSDIGPVDAIADALRDIRLHELATVAAMQSAVRALLAQFDPGPLRQAAERGGLSLVPRQRKADAWDAFEQLHARVTQALVDDFDSVFGKAFARAYEQALGEISAREVRP